jgi:hypothetical protein
MTPALALAPKLYLNFFPIRKLEFGCAARRRRKNHGFEPHIGKKRLFRPLVLLPFLLSSSSSFPQSPSLYS